MGIVAKALGFTFSVVSLSSDGIGRSAAAAPFIAFREYFAVANDCRKVFATAN
jgi:hypothetical protein